MIIIFGYVVCCVLIWDDLTALQKKEKERNWELFCIG
jgi:hypothetical protein